MVLAAGDGTLSSPTSLRWFRAAPAAACSAAFLLFPSPERLCTRASGVLVYTVGRAQWRHSTRYAARGDVQGYQMLIYLTSGVDKGHFALGVTGK